MKEIQENKENKESQKNKKENSNIKWFIQVFAITFILSIIFSIRVTSLLQLFQQNNFCNTV